jgi:hypothetical protein
MRLLLVSLLAAAALGAAATPALAHPFGPPLRVELEGLNYVVNLRWAAEHDDWVALARHTGAFEEVPSVVDGVELSGAERIARSVRLQAYLLERIVVTQYEMSCPGEVVHVHGDLVTGGIILQFVCEEPVYEVHVEVGVLTDVHPAYRTVATSAIGGVPGQALYTETDRVHRWDFYAAAGASPRTFGAQTVAALTGAALLAIAAVGLLLFGGKRPAEDGTMGSTKGDSTDDSTDLAEVSA